ncbi:exodeoxyribonuclease VII large subunit [Aidingimonas halophila]|uniref:Exodeoxyribonuclease 7 large subunit n=1 Tax=Aidingimonas halophila TaxID=574349 RepID=A0A1H2V561_9GAMM|nr:exodeoxyribonuclease VII large subunit [Aidingimonas halophila]GHC23770.1 exodeoxyribonuclease 7 large subunit [Aidingimonas halophila]SDW63455.1 Exodeoxyribonuclease VII large subunit [Aidingimonas halophila]
MTNDTTLTVSELNRRARLLLERDFGEIWVEGELSGVARPASGHVYFTLKDERAQLRCALFRNRARFAATPLRDGDRVRVRGKVSLFEPRGDYQLIVEAVQPAGAGDLLAAFEQLKQKLQSEGVFANARPLPYPPRHLVVMTSPTGAAVRDVMAVLSARWPLSRVSILPVPVQGLEAAPAMIRALAMLNREARFDPQRDCLLITRGGGSLEVLWAFNDEHLARAIFHSRLPVMSAVGHETDVTLADFAADRRAPTPSAAAEQLVPDRRDLRQRLDVMLGRLTRAQQGQLNQTAQRLDHLRARLRHPGERLAQQQRHVEQLTLRLKRAMSSRLESERQRERHVRERLHVFDPQQQLQLARQRLSQADMRLQTAMPRQLEAYQARLSSLVRELQAVSPLAVLGRGYAILQDEQGQVIRRADDAHPGQDLTARLGEGHLNVEVKQRFPSS